MPDPEHVSLNHLLVECDVAALLDSFARLAPGSNLALVSMDGHPFARAGNWSETNLQMMQVVVSEGLMSLQNGAGQMIQSGEYRVYPLRADPRQVGMLVACGMPTDNAANVERALQQSLTLLLAQALEKHSVASEALERYRELNLLYRVSATIGTILNPTEIPEQVLAESKRVIKADLGLVLLAHAAGQQEWEIKASFGMGGEEPASDAELHDVLDRVWLKSEPDVVTDLPAESQDFGSFLWVPLKTQERILGGVVMGRKHGAPEFTSSDEKLLMALSDEAAIDMENARLHQAAIEEERLAHELHLARQVQATLIPRAAPRLPGWDFAAWWQPAREMSGDFYDFFPTNVPNHAAPLQAMVIGDVTDKGMPAALFMALSRSIVRTSATVGRPPAESLTHANQLLCADSTDSMFVTLFYGQLDPDRQTLTYVNGGHNPPILSREEGQEIVELKRTGIMLGFDPNWQFEQRTLQLEPGDLIVFYTDGLTEAVNEQREQFGKERLLQLIREHRSENPVALLNAIQQVLHNFIGDTPPYDDITLVIAKCGLRQQT